MKVDGDRCQFRQTEGTTGIDQPHGDGSLGLHGNSQSGGHGRVHRSGAVADIANRPIDPHTRQGIDRVSARAAAEGRERVSV